MKRKLICSITLLATLVACGKNPALKAFVGGGMLDTQQMQMVDDSILLISGPNIRAAGHRSVTPLPAAAEKIDMKGRFLVPIPPILDERELDTPVSTMEKLLEQVDARRPVILGMPADTTEWAPHTFALLRAQRTKIAPRLSKLTEGAVLEIAKKNTKRLLDEDVRFLIGPGVDPAKEMALLASIGFDNKSLITAYFVDANLNAGSDANLDIVRGNPLTDWRNLFQLEIRIVGGQTQAAK